MCSSVDWSCPRRSSWVHGAGWTRKSFRIAEESLPRPRPDRKDVFVGFIRNAVLFVQAMSACGSIDLQDDRLLVPELGIKVVRAWKEGIEDERTPPALVMFCPVT